MPWGSVYAHLEHGLPPHERLTHPRRLADPRWSANLTGPMPSLSIDRAEVLHALALVARGREPIPEGLARLALDDPLLAPWRQRLTPDLLQGMPLGAVLQRHGLLEAREAQHLDQHRDPAALLLQMAEGTFRQPWTVRIAHWLPSLVAATVGLSLLGAQALFEGFLVLVAHDLEVSHPSLVSTAGTVALGVTIIVLLQVLLREIRGLRWLDLLLFPDLHRAWALVDLHALAAQQTPPRGWRRWWSATGMGADRREAPPWDRPWRTWWMLTRWRLTRGQREGMRALLRPVERLRAVAGWDPAQAHHHLRVEAERCRPWVSLTLTFSLVLGGALGFVLPTLYVVDAFGGGNPTIPLSLGFLLALVGLLMLPMVGIETFRLIALWVARAPPEEAVRSLLQHLADDVRAGTHPSEAIERTLIHLPMPWCWRARRLLRTWQGGEGIGLVESLARHRLLPRSLVPGGNHAEATGPTALGTWLQSAAEAPSWAALLAPKVITTLAHGLGCGVVLWFISTAILPRMLQIYRDLRVPLPSTFQLLAHELFLPFFGFGMLTILVLVVLVVSWRTWAAVAQDAAGRAILAGVAQGLPEAHLPGGKPGDFAAAAATAGFAHITTPTALAEAIAHRTRRQRQRRLVVATLFDLTLPLLLAVPVAFTSIAIMESLIQVLHHLEALP